MSTNIIKQLPSRYFLKDGQYCVEYKFKVNRNHYYLTDLKVLWEVVFGEGCKVNLTSDQKEATFYEVSDRKAVRYTQQELEWLFHDLLVLGFVVPNKTPDKHKVEGYS